VNIRAIFSPRSRLVIISELVNQAIDAICKSAKTKFGDGKIFIVPVEELFGSGQVKLAPWPSSFIGMDMRITKLIQYPV
jgi:hypothetical protein